MKVPFIPEDTPFSEDQKSWLSGFFAGLHTRMAMGQAAAPGAAPVDGAAPAQATAALKVQVAYGSQTGNAEMVAEDLVAALGENGMETSFGALDDIDITQLPGIEHLLIVTSTYGEGEMPDNAELFWDALKAQNAPRLENMTFSVLALGDTGYDEFCKAGKDFDLRLEQLGAKRIHNRVDCDIDYDDPAAEWTNGVLEALKKIQEDAGTPGNAATGKSAAPATAKPEKSKWSRKSPYASKLNVNKLLSGADSAKEIRHYEFALAEDGPTYEAGDALGVIPRNDPALVDKWLARLSLKADAAVSGQDVSLATVLQDQLEISTPSKEFLAAVCERAQDDHFTHILEHGDKEALEAFLWSKDSLDLLEAFPQVSFTAEELISVLKPLQHRAYSISSSSKIHTDSVHLTIASVRYTTSNGRQHGGVCSTYLADRVAEGDTADIFVSPNKAFRVPADPDAPMIMVGPGTGIAPFRAFLEERQATGARGTNWLFFGDQHEAADYIYRDELEHMHRSGLLTRLDLAFSRDQAEKIYVQHRMMQQSKALYAWLEEGGSFYVCGDATRMAKDVDQALHDVIAAEGGLSADGARDYVNGLKKEKRYLRDVY